MHGKNYSEYIYGKPLQPFKLKILYIPFSCHMYVIYERNLNSLFLACIKEIRILLGIYKNRTMKYECGTWWKMHEEKCHILAL